MSDQEDPKFPTSNATLYRLNGTLMNVKGELEKLNVTMNRIANALDRRQ